MTHCVKRAGREGGREGGVAGGAGMEGGGVAGKVHSLRQAPLAHCLPPALLLVEGRTEDGHQMHHGQMGGQRPCARCMCGTAVKTEGARGR